MGRVRASISVIVRVEDLAATLNQLPEATVREGAEAQSAGEGEAEVSVTYAPPAWTVEGEVDPRPDLRLFFVATHVTARLYEAGIPCRVDSWGSSIEDG